MTSRTEAKNEVINRPEENQLKEVTQWLDGHDHDEYEGSEWFGDVVIAPKD